MSEFTRKMLVSLVYYAARDGFAKTIYLLLSDQPEYIVSQVLATAVDDHNSGNSCTPLIIAAKNGHNNVVRLLLGKYMQFIEQEGTVKFDGYVIDGATGLWCAAAAGHYKVVKTFVEFHADVNHATKTKSTALRAASFDGRLDIVSYLVENGADVNLCNNFNNSCLMISSFRGHLDVVLYLISKGANINAQARCGATALHFAAEAGHLPIVKEFMNNGATFIANNHGMTPLIAAADRAKSEVVLNLIQHSVCTRSDKIDALEILGASHANDKDCYDIGKAYHFLELAMKERFSKGEEVIHKKLTEPIEPYQNHIESQTLEDLESIKDEANALHMECLVIRERILGSHNPELSNQIIFRGAVFADSARFDRCLLLWLHGLKLRHRIKIVNAKDLLRFAQLFSQMLYVGVELQFRFVEEVIRYTIQVLESDHQKLKVAAEHERKALNEEHDINVLTMLYLLVIVCKLLKYSHNSQPSPVYISTYTEEEKQRVLQLIYKLNQLNIHNSKNSTLLHLAVSEETFVDDFHTNDVCKFPCSATSRLLIECGADVNALDSGRNTPLHIIAKYQRPITDFSNLHSIIMTLIENGAHLDCVNSDGNTPYEAATTGVTEIILRTQSNICLKCIAARSVQYFMLPYKGLVPYSLEKFIEMHGVPRK